MSTYDNIEQQVVQELFAKEVSFSWKMAKLDSFVLSEWMKQQTYRKYVVTYSKSHCFKLMHTVR